METRLKAIIQIIEDTWQHGIIPGDDTLSFLDSTFGICRLADVCPVWDELDSSEHEMIMEMILFPEDDLRLQLEPFVGFNGISPEKIHRISKTLHDSYPAIQLLFPGEPESLNLELSFEQILLFVSRLFVDRSLDSVICNRLEKHRNQDEVMGCRLLMRKAGMAFSKEKQTLMIQLIERAQDIHPNFLKLFEMTLTILAQIPENQPLSKAFIAKRQEEKKLLDSIVEFEKKIERYNMEYLMMQRYPVPHDSYENTWERLRLLDIIITRILGIPLPMEPVGPQVRDLGRLDPNKDIDDILKLFSK